MTRDGELRALLFLRLLPGVGDRRLGRALAAHGSAGTVLRLADPEFGRILGRAAKAARSAADRWSVVDGILERSRALDIRIAAMGDALYPTSLLPLSDPPPVLFLRGNVDLLDRRAIAIVGSRRATATGRRTAERLARELSEAGVVVVSGLALGVDGAAHRGALEGVGGTVAVLGSGPDRAYPSGNRRLFEAIVERGLVVSEFPPGEPARPYHFPRRNRVLAALAAGVVVVQAARRSGALITVDHALDLGLDVFAVPGSVERRQAQGTNALLRDGAHVLTCGRDLLEVMGWTAEPQRWAEPAAAAARVSKSPEAVRRERVVGVSGSDRSRVRTILETSPRPVDALVLELGIPTHRVLAALTRLELEGVACREGGGWTCRNPR